MRRLLVVIGIAAMVAGVVRIDDAVSASEVEAFLLDRGWLGPIVFVVVMWVFQPLLVPGPVFMVPAALVWSAPAAMALSWVGNMGASFVAFAFARWLARDWVQARLTPRLRRWDGRLQRGGIREVALLRVFTGQITPADWLLGASSVRVRPFLIGTAIGIIPSIVIVVLLGASAGDWLFDEPARWGGVAAAVVGLAIVSRVRGRRRAAAAQPS